MRVQPQHILLGALFAIGLVVTPFSGLLARSLPDDEFEPPLVAIEVLRSVAPADIGELVDGSLPEPADTQAWLAEELDAEDRLFQAPARRAADLYRAPLTPECAQQGPGSAALAAGGGSPTTPQAEADNNWVNGPAPGTRCESGLARPGSGACGFILKKVYFSIRNGYAGRELWTLLSPAPRLVAACRTPHPAPLSVIVPTTVPTSPEFLV